MMLMEKRRRRNERKAVAKRVALYGGIFFFLAVIQCAFFSRLDFLPATPDLLVAAVAVIAVTDTKETAMISALVGGVVIDAIGGVGMYLSPVLYLIVAVVIGIFAKKMNDSYPSWVALMPTVCLLRALFTMGQTALFGGAFVFTRVLTGILLPELIVTFIFALPLYPLIRLCALPLKRLR